jgi:D-arabinose 1-dehydrogenase-like Zn-dependent alcohol dehydrogenase
LSPEQADRIQGLKPNGHLILVASHHHQPLQFPSELLMYERRTVTGWESGHAKDSEEAMSFAVLKSIRPMVKTHPLEQAESTFQNMAEARFRAVLTA